MRLNNMLMAAAVEGSVGTPAPAQDLAVIIDAAVAKGIAQAMADRRPVTEHARGIEGTARPTPGIEADGESAREEPGFKFARYARTRMAAHLTHAPAIEIAKELARSDRRYGPIVKFMAEMDERTKALGSSLLGEGAALLPTPLYQDYIDLLRPAVVVRAMGALEIPVPTGTMSLGRIDSDASATYVGENVAPNASQPGTGQLQFSAKKLLCIVPVGNDFLRRGGAGSEAIVRKGIMARARVREDAAFIRGDGTQDTPKGILNWTSAGNKFLSAVTAAGTGANGTNADTVNADLSKARRLLKNSNTPWLKVGWIFSPRTEEAIRNVRDQVGGFLYKAEMDRGFLDGLQYRTTTQIPDNLNVTGGNDESEIYLADFSEVLIGDTMQLAVDTFDGAAYKDSLGNMQSGVSADQTVLRLISEHDLVMQHSTSSVVIQACHHGA